MEKTRDDLMLEIYRMLQSNEKKSLFDLISTKKDALGLTDIQLAKILNITNSTFGRILNSIKENDLDGIDFYLSLKLCQLLGLGIEEMAQVYVSSLKPEKIKEIELTRKANYIIENFDLKGLKKAGFIKDINDFEGIEDRIVKFFGLNTVFEYKVEVGGTFFSRTKSISNDKMREFWVRSAIFQFQKIKNPNLYDQDKLLSIIPKIRPYTRYEEKGFLTVLQALFNIGITVIVQSYLTKTQVRGGTFEIDGKPCIVITDFNKSYATLWFALLHEIYHAIYDLEELKSLKYHLTGEEQSELYLFREDMADYFACEMLFPKENMDYIQHMIKSPSIVNSYAEKTRVHPSIIYSFYCYEQNKKGNNVYSKFSDYLGKSNKAISKVKSYPWENETMFEEIEATTKILTPVIS